MSFSLSLDNLELIIVNNISVNSVCHGYDIFEAQKTHFQKTQTARIETSEIKKDKNKKRCVLKVIGNHHKD